MNSLTINKPLLIAHRGDTNNFEENTIEAFKSAFNKLADGVEMDLQLINGEIRVVHDYLYDKNKQYPLLKNILEQFSNSGLLQLEIKSFSLQILKPLQKLINYYSPKKIQITTSQLPLVAHISNMFPSIDIMVNFNKCHYRSYMDEELFIKKTCQLMKLMKANIVNLCNLPKKNYQKK